MEAAPDDAVKTYRYLRLAMVALVVLLGASIVVERLGTDCWQTSISGYYHTPAEAVFVGALVAIGVCLVVLKGSSELEDVLLNTAGMLAPVVAFVPTPDAGTCRSAARTVTDVPANVANNVWALLVTGALGVVVTAVVAARAPTRPRMARQHRIGIALAAAVVVAGIVWFLAGRTSFREHAHYAAALLLFACIVSVVWINARGLDGRRGVGGPMRGTRNRYTAIAVAMVVVLVGVGGVGHLAGWSLTVLWVEALLIGLFALFWVLQTVELWDEGVRSA